MTENDIVTRFARAHRVSPAQVRIAWTLSRGPHVLAIPGTGNAGHPAENLRAADLVGRPGPAALGQPERWAVTRPVS